MRNPHRARAGTLSKVIDLRWDDRDRHPTWTRLALVGVPLTGLLAVLGPPPIDLHGPLHYLGVMGPTCGMTRGVMWFVRGDLARAWQFNPASLLVIPGMVLLLGRATIGRLSSRWVNVAVQRRPWLWVVAALIVLLAIRQQLNADFLVANPAG